MTQPNPRPHEKPHEKPLERPHEPTIHTEFPDRLDYASYLQLDQLLQAQKTLSNPEHHDELLFIVQHQTSELWMKLVVHELQAAIRHVQADELPPAFKILARVKHVQRMLFEQWAVLETLTPTEYAQFRHVLGRASGFQSHQYRAIEFLLGNKDPQAISVFRDRPETAQTLQNLLQAPSLYDEFLRYLHRQAHPIPTTHLERDFTQPYTPSDQITQIFQTVYNDPRAHWEAYEMAEKLLDVEEQFALWRYRHALTVERVIGFKSGTGGSSGVPFLRAALKIRLFPELWEVRTLIGR